MSKVEQFHRSCEDSIDVRGFLHRPTGESLGGIVLTHGAGGNAKGPLLTALAEAFADSGLTVLRCDLPFRQQRPTGPPSPASAARDQAGLRCAAQVLKELGSARVLLGGQSYGGRQASLLAASDESVCDGLLLMSYPLHPPGKPGQLRTQHFPQLRKPILFVQGTKDPFGSVEEMDAAMKLLATAHERVIVEGAGHDLGWSRKLKPEYADLPARIVEALLKLINIDK